MGESEKLEQYCSLATLSRRSVSLSEGRIFRNTSVFIACHLVTDEIK